MSVPAHYDGGEITEFCPCHKHRPLATFTPHANGATIHGKAKIGVVVHIPVDEDGEMIGGEHPGKVQPGTARCVRRICRLLGRA